MDDNARSQHRAGGICDALRFLGDVSFAILPRDVAHQVGEFEKNMLGGIRWAIDKEIDWIDARVAGGDRLREEWKSRTQEAGQGNGV
jgi:hypothetical protein